MFLIELLLGALVIIVVLAVAAQRQTAADLGAAVRERPDNAAELVQRSQAETRVEPPPAKHSDDTVAGVTVTWLGIVALVAVIMILTDNYHGTLRTIGIVMLIASIWGIQSLMKRMRAHDDEDDSDAPGT